MYTMKKFLIYTVIFILSLFIIDRIGGACFGFLRDKVSNTTPNEFIPTKKMDHLNVGLVCIGSSRIKYHLDPKILSDSLLFSVYNCGKTGHWFFYENALFRSMVDQYKPKLILWNIDFMWDFQVNNRDPSIELTTLYPYYSEDSYIRETIDKYGDKILKIRNFFLLYRYNSIIYKYLRILLHPNANGYEPQIVNNRKWTPKRIAETFNDSILVDKDKIKMFANSLDYSIKKKVKVIILFSPRYVKSEYKKTNVYKSIVNVLREKHIRLLDYYQDPFFMDSTLYRDCDHLNAKGAQIYSKKVSHQLKGMYY